MKKLLILAMIVFSISKIHSQIVITEINYNSPDQDDLYEYLELYNISDDTINIEGFQFSKGIKHIFNSYLFPPQSYLLLAKDSTVITNLGVGAIIWNSGGLKNSGEAIVLTDSMGTTIDSVKFDDGGNWVSTPDGNGPALELCDFNKDNSNAKYWKASEASLNTTVNGTDMLGTPGKANSVSCDSEEQKFSLVINEIMYNDGVGQDSLEFIEILNNSADSIELGGLVLKSNTIDFNFPKFTLRPYNTFVIAKYPNLIKKYFNINADSWGQGGLNNKADTITIYDNANNIIDKVEYFEDGDWSNKADGLGYSLSLCDNRSDNNNGNNWQASPVYAGFNYKGNKIHANPGYLNYCSFDMDTLKKINTSGEIVNKYYNPFITGTVYGINFNPAGLQFVIKDDNNKGIWTYSHDRNFGYNLHEGDKVKLWGKLNQFKGLTQVRLDSIILIKTDSVLSPANIVTKLDESTEGDLITIENVKLVDYTKWTNSGSGFNVKVANSKDTFSLRIDSDTDIFGKPHPVGLFNITGLGGQYDKNAPYFDGYQLLPRYIEDINPYSGDNYPIKKINEVTQIDDEGKGISVGTNCELRGLVYGVNLRPSGLQFTIIDDLNDGIGVFSFSKKFGYTVNEGDYVSIKGIIGQYNGLLQIKPDTVILISSDHTLYNPQNVNKLGEETESQLVSIMNLKIKDLSQWKADGSGFSVTVTNGTDEFVMRIDNDVDLSTSVAPDYTFNLTGIGGQFDSSVPYTEGYQILPRYKADIEKTSGASILDLDNLKIYPNPATDYLFVDNTGSDIKSIAIYSMVGKRIISIHGKNKINIKDLKTGIYKIVIETKERKITKSFIKI